MKYLFEDDVNVACNQLGYLLSLSGLYWIVAFLILPKILGKNNIRRNIRYISGLKGKEAQVQDGMDSTFPLLFPSK